MSNDADQWIDIAAAIDIITSSTRLSVAEVRRKISNRFFDGKLRLVVDEAVAYLRTVESIANVVFDKAAYPFGHPIERLVERRIGLTPLMLPLGALDVDSLLWTGEASFSLPNEGPHGRVTYYGLRANLAEISQLAGNGRDAQHCHAAPLGRASAVKKAKPPSDELILAKADEMKSRGLTGRQIEKAIRHEPGYSEVSTVHVRELIRGRWAPSGRPKKGAG